MAKHIVYLKKNESISNNIFQRNHKCVFSNWLKLGSKNLHLSKSNLSYYIFYCNFEMDQKGKTQYFGDISEFRFL